MPLIKSPKKSAVSKNIKTEMEHGKPHKQAIAIALSVQRAAKRKKHAEGGNVEMALSEHAKEELKDIEKLEHEHEAMLSPEALMEHEAAEEAEEDEREESPMRMKKGGIVDAIRRKRMAEGGEVDLQANANEDLNMEDQLSYEAARKDTYYDLDQLSDQPSDSNMHGDEAEMKQGEKHSLADAIRRKMKIKR